jgi:hypothetical protein
MSEIAEDIWILFYICLRATLIHFLFNNIIQVEHSIICFLRLNQPISNLNIHG